MNDYQFSLMLWEGKRLAMVFYPIGCPTVIPTDQHMHNAASEIVSANRLNMPVYVLNKETMALDQYKFDTNGWIKQ